jgi:starch synthase (maltosyl-transferring)
MPIRPIVASDLHQEGIMVPNSLEGTQRVVIENVRPEIDAGRYPIKRVIGEKVVVEADIFADGHDQLSAQLLYRRSGDSARMAAPIRFLENDRWIGEFVVDQLGIYYYTLEAWMDHFKTWQHDLKKRVNAGQDVEIDLRIGTTYIEEAAKRASGADQNRLMAISKTVQAGGKPEAAISLVLGQELTELMAKYPDRQQATRYPKELTVVVDRVKARFSSWYERFPRSCSPKPGRHGTFKDCERILPEIARMGFDVLYLPPIHPIGKTNRKGKNNSIQAKPDEPGSPWAIGSQEGGHKAIHPELGSLDDFKRLVQKAKDHGIEIALDLAFQCAPDHPYVKEHPEWFRWRPDGTVQFAENPPKKYEDIIPINFETEDWKSLWEELRAVVLHWVEQGVRIFRVDNPHTKAFAFWEWLIQDVKTKYPDVIFLAEAFTRPKVMYRLAKLGFTQSYTYFTWRTSKVEFTTYLKELTQTEPREYFTPNFWPNTPDILPEHLQYGGRPVFLMRLILAATLSSNYGIYGPVFELCLHEPRPGVEEYIDNEKYEIKTWNWDQPGNIKDLIARVNRIRRENPALQTTSNLRFYEVDNDQLLFYGKATDDQSNVLLIIVNLDPFHTQSGWIKVPLHEFEIDPNQPYMVHDLLSDERYLWQGENNYIQLNPQIIPAHILRLKHRVKRETDFDYFM